MAADEPAARERYLTRGTARLYVREIGGGEPIIVLHGGPDFDHEYLLPAMDRLAESFRLVYYDQRGRGRSFSGRPADEVNLAGEIDDLDAVRECFGFETVALLGHSWGALLAMEYATRRPHRVSHLILMNTAPASHAGVLAFREDLQRRRTPEQSERMSALRSDPRYQAGDVATDLEYYRIHFDSTVRRPDQLDRVIGRLRSAFTSEGIVTARAIEDRLYAQTWDAEDYDLIARLGRLQVPTLFIHGDGDFVPIDVAREAADAIRGSRFVVLSDCGHFAYLEQPDRVRAAIDELMPHTARRLPAGSLSRDVRTTVRSAPRRRGPRGHERGGRLDAGRPAPRRHRSRGGAASRCGAMPLTAAELNRATLARQLLLRRESIDAANAVRRVVALQAQEPASPYLGLWNRIDRFDGAALDHAFADRDGGEGIGRADHPPRRRRRRLPGLLRRDAALPAGVPAERRPLHLRGADHRRRRRPGPRAARAARGAQGQGRGRGVLRAARMWWALRTFAPLLHAPTGPPWSFGPRPRYVAAGVPIEADVEAGRATLVRRYLEGFGPASAADIGMFTMLRKPPVQTALADLGEQLVRLEGPDGIELYDVPDGLIPAGRTKAPPRLLGMWDNVLLAYADRTRVLPDAYRPHVIRRNGDVLPTVLVDGQVAGVWRSFDGAIEVAAFHALPDGHLANPDHRSARPGRLPRRARP